MKAGNFVLQDYLDRIGFADKPGADLESVARMMACQLFTVPFENLDVQAGKLVSLVPEEIVDKIVGRGRGGYCYEVNGLFAMALGALGVRYDFVLARPMFYPMKRPRTHMAILATFGGEKWLFDLGFGSYGIRAPLPLARLDTEIPQGGDTFRLTRLNEREHLLEAWVDGHWAKQYSFDEWPQEWIDFMPANYLNSTHPDAVFVQKPLIVLHNHAGRKILFGDQLKTVADGRVETRSVARGDYETVLRDDFGLALPH